MKGVREVGNNFKILDEAVCILLCTYTFGKRNNPSVLSAAVGE